MNIEKALEAELNGEIPINCSKYGEFQRFGAYKRKNPLYF
jgi:hypothetical protein